MKHAKNITDIRSYRGADADSDHILVTTEMKQKTPPRIKQRKQVRRRYDTGKLKDITTLKHFQKEMAKQLEARRHTGQVQTEWTQIEVVMNKMAGKVLGYSERKVNNSRWFDEHCKKALDHRKNAKLKTMEDGNGENKRKYQQARRMAKKICKRAKITHLENELKELEEWWKSKELRNFYQEIKRGKGQHRKPAYYLKDKGGHLIGDKEGKLNRFAEYFEELLSKDESEMRESQYDSKEEQEDTDFEELLSKDESEMRESQYDSKEEQEDTEVETTLMDMNRDDKKSKGIWPDNQRAKNEIHGNEGYEQR
ncbi:hypothetical protein QE152_g19235 [Popillia japonica]|uniref:Uncharacterized protein n=1 Tax=Popillia japonica TaxID=7064 RepID=A0AAW1KRK6_POPJA